MTSFILCKTTCDILAPCSRVGLGHTNVFSSPRAHSYFAYKKTPKKVRSIRYYYSTHTG